MEKKNNLAVTYIGQMTADCENKKPDIRERVRFSGIGSISNQELIMLLLGSGSRNCPVQQLSKTVLEQIQKTDIDNLLNILHTIPGISDGKAAVIAAAFELGRRMYGFSGLYIRQPEDFIPLVQHYALQMREHFLCATVTGAHEIIQIRVVSVGTLNASLIHPREIFADALKDRCAAIILCHNHPSDSIEPSLEDIEVTLRIQKSCTLLGIRLLDHLIITRNAYFSFKAAQLIE